MGREGGRLGQETQGPQGHLATHSVSPRGTLSRKTHLGQKYRFLGPQPQTLQE